MDSFHPYIHIVQKYISEEAVSQRRRPLLSERTFEVYVASPVREGLPAGIGGRVAGTHELDPLQSDPGSVGRTVETSVLHDLTQERDHSLRACVHSSTTVSQHAMLHTTSHILTVFVIVREIYLVTKQHNPFPQLHGSHHHAVGRAAVLTVVVKCLQQ